ncbi:MAG TPA: FAD-dependent oxidoreductase [Solirubrobacteraceae bacterium]|nr:FAD-dependent oxidoreductase [Solirubrobacteraceae bacterium]
MRIVVLGAGIVGVHVALELAGRDAEVTLIEAGEPGGGTTAGSFAWIDASAPGIADYLELRLVGVRAWHRRAGEPWLSLPGTVAWASDAEVLEAHAERLAQLGGRVERMTVRGASEYEPDLVVPDGVETVYRFPGEGWLRPTPAVADLLDRARAAGVRVQTGTRVGALEFEDVVVSCLGRWTQAVLGAAGVAVPMLGPDEPGVAGLVARTSPVRSRLSSVVLADGLMIRPEPDGRLLMNADAGDAGTLLEMLRRRVRGAEGATVEEAWVCRRAIPGDRLPVVGWAREGLYVVATHSGVTLAPALAELVASEVIDGADRDELTRFRPDRFRTVVT